MLSGNALTDANLKIAHDAYESYKKAHMLIDALESIGIGVEGGQAGGKIGSLFGIMDEQLRIIGLALDIDWLGDDEKIARFEKAIEGSLEIDAGRPGIPDETLEILLAMRG